MPATGNGRVTLARPRFSYYTLDARNRDYTVLVRESRNNSAHHTTDSAVGGSSDDGSSDDAVVVLDVNALDDDSGYLDLGLSIVCPDETLLAYSVDTTGDEVYTLRFRDLRTGADLAGRGRRAVYYGGAWTADSSAFLYTVPRRGLPARPGVAAPPRHARRRRRARARRAGRAASSSRSALSRSERRSCWCSESRDTGEVWDLDADRLRPRCPARSAAGGPGWTTTPSTSGACPASGTRLAAPGHQRRRRGVPAGRVPGARSAAARPTTPGARCARRTRPSGWSGSTRSPAHVVASAASRRRAPAAGARRSTTSAGAGCRGGQPVRRRRGPAGAQHARTTPTRSPSPTSPAPSRRSRPTSSLVDGAVTDQHRHEAPGHDPAAYLSEIRTFPAPDGTLVPATLVRHRDTPLDGTAPALV